MLIETTFSKMKDENDSNSLWTRCKLVAVLVVVFVIVEILTVSRWENAHYASTSTEGIFNRTWNSKYNLTNNTQGLALNDLKTKPNELTKQYGKSKLSQATQDELKVRLANATDKKLIVVWVPAFGNKRPITINAEKCGNCEATYDREKINDEKTVAVTMHFDAIRPGNVPPTRNPNHLYIFSDMESTATLKVARGMSLKFEDSIQFNASCTYRRDSDFLAPYGNYNTLTGILKGNKLTPEELLKLKTKTALAIVSNCAYTPGAVTRIKMLKELMRLGINLEAYGGCFGDGNFTNGHRQRDEEYHTEVRKYKFYFAFENSHHCKDYITEKFYNNALESLAVPVVWGPKREDYEVVAPPGSFIHVEDFKSLKELAEHIKYLNENDDAYLEYLRWTTLKPSDMPSYERESGWCQICRALHGINVDDIYNPKYDPNNPKRPLFTEGMAPRTIPSLSGWFYGEDNPECFNK